MLPEEEDYTPASLGYFFYLTDRDNVGGIGLVKELIMQSKPDSSKTFFWSYMLPAESFDTATQIGQTLPLFPKRSHNASDAFSCLCAWERQRRFSKDLASPSSLSKRGLYVGLDF